MTPAQLSKLVALFGDMTADQFRAWKRKQRGV